MQLTHTEYKTLANVLQNQKLDVTPADIHGFLSGLLCAGQQDQRWRTLVHQFLNNDHAFPVSIVKQIETIYETTQTTLADDGHFAFTLWLDERDVFSLADSLSEWVNNFMLAIGVAQPDIASATEDIQEALNDLQDIARLGYDEDDDAEELEQALTEIIEYVQIVAMFFYSSFNQKVVPEKKVLH